MGIIRHLLERKENKMLKDIRKKFASYFPADGTGEKLESNPLLNDVRNDNGQRPIAGYRVLNDEEVALINAIKALGVEVQSFIGTMEVLNHVEAGQEQPLDPRWIGIARTQLQQGFMALTRAVAKPQGF